MSLIVSSQSDAGAAISFQWSANRLPAHGTVKVQRRVGTSGAWKTVEALHGASGSNTLPALSIGRYPIRIAAFDRHGRVVATANRTLYVYSTVPFSRILDKQEQTTAYPTFTFNYVISGYEATLASVAPTDNPCRSVHIEAAGHPGVEGDRITLSLIQQAAEPVTKDLVEKQLLTFDANLTPGQSWAFTQMSSAATGFIQVNGSANCYEDDFKMSADD